MAKKNIYQTEEVRAFAAAMSDASRLKYNMISKEELERGIRATRKQLEEARKDPLFLKEVETARAEQTAYQIMESLMRTVAFKRKMNAYHEIFHRDFGITVTLGECTRRNTRLKCR